jgi:hypothetical protein
VVSWSNFSSFGILYKEKSGSPASKDLFLLSASVGSFQKLGGDTEWMVGYFAGERSIENGEKIVLTHLTIFAHFCGPEIFASCPIVCKNL